MTLLGTRVVRGPDWEWQNQDGGEGHVGTVVQIGKYKKSPTTAQLVWVQWDCGSKANYRAGFDGKHDLKVFDNAIGGKHLYVMCDGCQKDPIAGMRWHCLSCPNFELCTTCYMTDKHDLEHRFERIDKSRGKRVNVGSRKGSDKQEARGMFKGAKVVRGPDWEWKNQDGGACMEGEVADVASWDNDESAKNAVRVYWKEGQRSNIYRLGKDGKVDLKCTMAVSGGSYYKDHLPVLKVELKKSQGGLTTGDKVILQVSEEKLQELCDGHGGWNADMKMFIRKVGVIQDFTSNGDVLVEYPENVWRFNPAALSKIQEFKRGDEVIIKSEKNLVKDLQEGHGGWNEAMISILGRTGKVLQVDGTGDLVVSVEGGLWMLNPAAVTCVTDPEPGERSPIEDGSSEDPLGLFHLFREFLGMHHAFDQRAGQRALDLLSACKSNQLSRVKEILDSNPKMIDEVQGAHSVLHLACHEGHCDIIRELIDRGASREILDSQGYTAIHHAAYGDKTGEAVKLLLEKGFDPNVQQSNNKSTPLHLAVKNDNDMAVRILAQSLECDVNLQDEAGDTPLYDAIASDKHNMVDMLLNNSKLSVTVTNKRGFNYLQFAVLKGNTRAVEKSLAKAGDILNVAKSDGFTTLHIAAINDHREIAKILLKQPGCRVDAPTQENQTALHLAASEGYSVMCEILLDYGACVNAKDNDNDTPLHITLAKETLLEGSIGQLSALRLLLRGRNSVSYAAVSRCLLSYGADVLQANKNGETPLDRCDGTEVEQLIREIANSPGNAQVTKVPSFGVTKATNPEQNVCQVSSHSGSASMGTETQGQAPSERDDQNVVQDNQCSETSHQRPDSPLLQNDEDDDVNTQETDKEEILEEESLENKLVDNTMEQIQENIVLEVTNQVPQESFTAEFSNSSSEEAVQVKEMNNAELVNDSGADHEFGEGEQEPNQTNMQRESQTIVENTESEVQKRIEGKEERPKCYICEENEAEVAFKPCGHIVVCTECASRLKRCLECRAKITGKATRGLPSIDERSPLTAKNLEGFSIYETFLKLTPYIRPKDILMRLNLLAFSYKMSVLISSKQNELALLFVSQDVYNQTFYRSHETSALVQLRAQGFTEVHVRPIGVQDEKRIYNSESFHVSICLGEDYKFVDSQNSSFHFAVGSYVWWNTGHVIKIPLKHTKDVRILCGKISVEGQYGHSSERHFCESDLNGYVMELLGAKGEICNLLPIARKLMMPEESIDRIVKSWKDEDQQLEKIVQFWKTKKDILENHQALRQDLEGLQQDCQVTQRGQMHIRHLRDLANKVSGLQLENSDLWKNFAEAIQTCCRSIFQDCCIELEDTADRMERAASSLNHVHYLEMHGAIPKAISQISHRICSYNIEVSQSIITNFLTVVPHLIQTMKEIFVQKEFSVEQNGLRGLPDSELEQFVSNVRDAERKNKARQLTGEVSKVLKNLCLENCDKTFTDDIEKWGKTVALPSMLEFLKPFFQNCPQNIRLHKRLELFSEHLYDILLDVADVVDDAFLGSLSNVALNLIDFAKFEPSKLVRFELFDDRKSLLPCSVTEDVKYDPHNDTFSQRFQIGNRSDVELQIHALACVPIDGRIQKIGAFQSAILLCPSGEPVFEKCMTRFCGVVVARQKDKVSENVRMVLCSTQNEKLLEALDVLKGELSGDLVDFKESVITRCHLTMRSVPGRRDAVLSLRLVYKWRSEAVFLDSSDFLHFADSTADGAWVLEVQLKGLTGPDELAEEARSALTQASGVGNTFPLDTFDTQGMRKHTVINGEKTEYHFHKTYNYMTGHVCVAGDQTTLNDQSSSQRALQEGTASDPMRRITDRRRYLKKTKKKTVLEP